MHITVFRSGFGYLKNIFKNATSVYFPIIKNNKKRSQYLKVHCGIIHHNIGGVSYRLLHTSVLQSCSLALYV